MAIKATLSGLLILLLSIVAAACTSMANDLQLLSPEEQVMATERAFAATMAARDFDAFATFIDPEAIFIEVPQPLRGRQQVLDAWKTYFEGPQAPFSWTPDQVEVLASGTLAHSSGPVINASGVTVARFNSIWRRQPSGSWKIIFDKGSPLAD